MWVNEPGLNGEGYPRHISFISEDERDTAEDIAKSLGIPALKI